MVIIQVVSSIFILFLVNCEKNKCKSTSVYKNTVSVNDTIKTPKSEGFTKECNIDEYVNDSIKLWDSDAIRKAFGSLKGKINQYVDKDHDIYFKDKNNNTYLRLIYMGEYDSTTKTINHENFGACEIGFIKDISKIKMYPTKYNSFYSGEAIKLNMNIKSFLKVNKLYIDRTDTIKNGFIFYHDCPGQLYFSEYKFKNNKLVKFSYGFYNP